MIDCSVVKAAVVSVVVALVAVVPSKAAEVSGGYMGTVSQDDGLGLIGQTMTAQFTYDDTTPVSFSSLGTSYDNPLTSATVTIGANVWTWNSADYSSITLYDNDIILIPVGEEDRAEIDASTFSGPSLVPNVEDFSYSLSIYLNDEEPDGNPDGLSSEDLPSMVPDPGLFQYTQFERPIMTFSFISGDAELGTFYQIEANNLRLIPEPASLGLLALSAMALVRRRRRLA